jgi:hypothetical protein
MCVHEEIIALPPAGFGKKSASGGFGGLCLSGAA